MDTDTTTRGMKAGRTFPSYEESVQKLYGRVLGYMLNRTHDRQLAEDLTQETFLRAYRAYSRLAPESNIDHWIITLATSAIGTHFRRKDNRSTERFSLEAMMEETGDTFQANTPDVEETCTDRIILQAAIQQLSGSYQETILLLAQGRSYQDMAELQESTIGMVASRVRRARHMLHKALKQAGYNHREER